jgi:hypothetical protein
MIKRALRAAGILALSFMSCEANGWSLKTHLWISDQVIADVIDDCKITLKLRDGSQRTYPVPADACSALRARPDLYRAGHLGPDVFPDPVTGQMTTHPGIEHGWLAERWMRQVLESAAGDDELAFAYGFLGHASGDILAHTFVNQYAGDIFLLTDGETKVELRHFSLEKYIESKTPGLSFPTDAGGIGIPAKYLSQILIYNDDVSKQYQKQAITLHLASLQIAKKAVDDVSRESRKITDRLVDFYADFYKLQAKELAKIASFEREVELAKASLRAAEAELKLEEDALALAQKAVDEAEKILSTYGDLITALNSQISDTLNAISAAAGTIADLSKAKQRAVDALNAANANLGQIVCDTKQEFCNDVTNNVCSWLRLGKVCKDVTKTICHVVDISDPQCGAAKAAVSAAVAQVNALTSQLEQQIARETQLQAKKAALEAEKLEKQATLLATQSAIAGLRATLSAHKALVDAKQVLVGKARELVAEAEKRLEEIKKAAEPVLKLVDSIADVMKEYNLISLMFANWRDGIERAGADFMDASMETGFGMMNEDGNIMEHYKKWLQCSAHAYLGVPWQLPYTYCTAQDKVEEIKAAIDRLKEQLPPIVRWLLDPLADLREEAIKVAKKEVWNAAKHTADFVMGPPTGRFIGMLASQEKATADAVRDIFRSASESGGKKLVTFDDVIALVDADIGLSNGALNPETFHALRNAVTLSKLSLLDAGELSQLFKDLVGELPTQYGPELYGDQRGKRFSLLFYAVRSIDGNHQWQAFGLPYLRSDGSHGPSNPNRRRYGYSYHDNHYDGFRLFQDPIARERVFLQLFSGPVEGSMAKIPQAQWPGYKYPACDINPFPRTVSDLGQIMLSDPACVAAVASLGGPAPKARVTAYIKPKPADRSMAGRRSKPSRFVTVRCAPHSASSAEARITVRLSRNNFYANGKHIPTCSSGPNWWGPGNVAGWWHVSESNQ